MVVKVLFMELYDILFSMIPNMKVFWDLGYIPLLFKYYCDTEKGWFILGCGENVGTEENIVHGSESDYSIICNYEFFGVNNTDLIVALCMRR